MTYHQVVMRKGGPQHGIAHKGKGEYSQHTLCGLRVSRLAKPIARRFENADTPCGRCTKTAALT